jgi:uncharacterized protein YkwD
MSMPLALLLAALVIVGLFVVAAVVAPQLAPAFSQGSPGDSSSLAAPSPAASTTGSPTAPSSTASPSTSLGVSPGRKASPKPSATGTDRITSAENEVLRLVNVERGKAGCTAVHADSRLHKAARDFSALMAAKNFFDHVSPDGSTFVDRIARAGYPRDQAAAENIAYGYLSAAAVMKGWMNSDGHRRNILNCDIKAIGVGLAYRGSTPYWTQDFGRQ